MSYLDSSDSHENEYSDRNYFVRHWKGALSLPVAYWLNATLLVGGIGALSGIALGSLEYSSVSLRTISIVSLLVFITVVAAWIWSVVGIWRSADRHVERGGAAFWAGAAKVIVALGAIGMAAQVPGMAKKAAEFGQLAFGNDPLGPPTSVTLQGSGERIEVRGAITSGAADRFRAILDSAPAAREVVLDSIGGRILEAQRMAQMIAERRLNTRVETLCESACTFLLLAGHERTAAADARIGFHQPSFPGLTSDEQRTIVQTNREDYRRAGVAPWFLERAMAARPESMWYPDQGDLVAANVLTSSEIVISSSAGQTRASVHALLAQVAQQLNSETPTRIDEITTLQRAAASGLTLSYLYSMDVDRSELELNQFRGRMRRRILSQVCGDAEMTSAVAAGASFRYAYSDRSGDLVYETVVNSCS